MFSKKELIVKIQSMGFLDEKVEKAFFYTDICSIEEAMYYLVPNKDGFWEHKFIPESCITPVKQ